MSRKTPELSASLLCADFTRLEAQLDDLRAAGIDRLHQDFVAGHDAENLGLGTEVFALLADRPEFRLESHMTIESPQQLLHPFVPKSAWVIFHPHAADDSMACFEAIPAGGARPGIAGRPELPVGEVLPLLPHVDLVDVLTVPPGFAGGTFYPQALGKIEQLRLEITQRGLDVGIEADGGVNRDTAQPSSCASSARGNQEQAVLRRMGNVLVVPQ